MSSSLLFYGDEQAFPVDDEAYIINGMHDKLSFRALLSLCLNHDEQTGLSHLLPPQLISTAATSNFNSLPYDVYPPMPENVAFGSFSAFPPTLIRSLQCGDLELKFSKMPRQDFSTHHFGSYGYGGYGYNNSAAVSTEPSNCFADDGVSCDYGFRHLPDLRSLEKQQPLPLNTEEFGFRPPRNIGGYILDKATGNYQPPATRRHPHREPRKAAAKTESRSCKLARERRQKQCEKIRYLQKLMPWETKMDTTKMLEEAHKYVKFLQAQVRVLQTMPVRGALPSPNTTPALHGTLAKLSRQQLLEALVNSPAAQTFLYSRGCCVYSVEQLALLGKVVDRKALFEQMLIASASMLRS
ncbi:PREDICTED: uncharacterized protein LOC109163414 [Ipomoea nil]|uniref:uncharacterized protein LOC109163414 n=1 Tax=Ipomoea nil TaxID=35883 RepID=UPI0009012D2E|nr:PREDICTED: uncharacterized protein LOC109163414 [Ipomoea nil]